MKKLIVLLFLFPSLLFAQEKRAYFSNLIEAKCSLMKNTNAFLQANYESAEYIKEFEGEFGTSIPIAYVRISKNQKHKILLTFTEGYSGDPAYEFYKTENKKHIYLFSMNGTSVYIPGNGNIYIAGHTNNMFDKRKKYVFKDGEAIEVAQALYYVGLKAKCSKNVQIYSDFNCTKKLAIIAKNSEIEVVAAEFSELDMKYLIKTPFGLMGWWHIDIQYPASEIISELFFIGD